MSAPSDTLVGRFLRGLARRVLTHPRWFIVPQFALFAVCVLYTVANLEFVMDRNSLLDSTLDYNRNFLAYREQFPAEPDLVAVIESEDPEKNRQFVERLAARLEAASTLASRTNLLSDVFYKGDLKLMGPKALMFVPSTNLVELKRVMEEYRPFLDQFAGASNLVSLFSGVNTAIRTSGKKSPEEGETLVQAIPALERIVRRATETLDRRGTPPSPGVDALFSGGNSSEDRKYITLGGGRIYLVTARPRAALPEEIAAPAPSFWGKRFNRERETGVADPLRRMKSVQADINGRAVHQFRKLVEAVEAEVTGVNAGVTGENVLDYDEMIQSRRDTTVATVVSLVLVAIIFVFGYQEVARPLKSTACLIVGIGYTMAFTTATVGHLNILTITFVPMLIGLAIDFGVHLITRFEEELRRGHTEPEAMTVAMVFTGKGIFTGCLTTAGAFLAMCLTHFRGIREMGIICGGGIVICLVPMMTLLPALLVRSRRPVGAPDPPPHAPGVAREAAQGFRARVERLWLDRPGMVLGFALAMTLGAAFGLPRVHFDYNLLNMQSPEIRSVEFEYKLLASSEKSVIFGAVVATNLAEARDLEDQLLTLPTVASVESMARFLSPEATNKIPLIQSIGQSIQSIRFADPDHRPVDLDELGQTLYFLGGYLALAADEVRARGNTSLLQDITSFRESLVELRARLFRGAPAELERRSRKLGAFQVALLEDLRDTIDALRHQESSGTLRPGDLPDPLRHRFIGIDGSLLLQVYPRSNVWDRAPQEAFIQEVQTVVPRITGAPVQMYYYTELLKKSYIEAAGWALAVTVLLVGFHFRSVVSVLLALLPVGLGTLWVVGFMGWTGIHFNPANIMMLPLVIGIGITNGIHILNRFAEERNPSILAKSTGKAVFVSGLTTVVGFGSLLLAQHQGIRSLGLVMALGTATCMIAGLAVLPAVLTLRERKE